MIPGILLLIVFALVIPGFWFLTVYLNRRNLDVSEPPSARRAGWLAGAGSASTGMVVSWVVGCRGAA